MQVIAESTGASLRTVSGWRLALEREHLLTREQAGLVLAHQKGVDIRKYVSKDGLEEIRRIVTEQPAQVPFSDKVGAPQTVKAVPPAKRPRKGATPPTPVVRMENTDVTEFMKAQFEDHTRSKLGKRLKVICGDREDLRRVLLRDISDAVRCYAHGVWKSCVVLCGGTIEGILTALLESEPSSVVDSAYARARKGKPKKALKNYTLEDKLDVAAQLGILAKGSASYGHGVRNYRNYVHPAEELRIGYPLGQRDARIALELVLKILDEVG